MLGRRQFLLDRGLIAKCRRGPGGQLIIPARVGRIGVQQYPYGGVLRHPEDVFAAASVDSLVGATITWLHLPDEEQREVTPENWKRVSVGFVRAVRPDGQWLVADLAITHAPLIAAIDAGDAVEVSCGYHARTVPSRGVWENDPHLFRQTQIEYNHVALGPENWARAGSDACLILDSKLPPMAKKHTLPKWKPITLSTDGLKLIYDGIEVDPADAKAVEGLIARHAAQRLTLDQLDLDQTRALVDEIQGMLISANETVARLMELLAAEGGEASASPEVLDERIEIIDRAKQIKKDVEIAGRTNEEIMHDALVAALGEEQVAPHGEDASWIRGRFAGLNPAIGTWDAVRATIGSGASRSDGPPNFAQLRKAARDERRKAAQRTKPTN